MRAVCILAVATVLSILAAACGGSGGLASLPTAAPTPFPLDALRDRAAPLCAAAVAGTAPRGTGTPGTPIAPYLKEDDSGLERKYQTGNLSRDWKSYTGITYKVLNSFETEWLEGFRLQRVEDVKSIVCLHDRWMAAGTYERSEALGVRRDWTAYILSWPDGAVLTTRSFRGADPPATRETTAGQGGCSVCTEPGKPPAKEAHAWLHSLLDGPAATATATVPPPTLTVTQTRTPVPPTASTTTTRTPSPTVAASVVPGCTLCGVHSLPNGVTLEVRANAYEGWSTSADGRDLTLRIKAGATARVQGAACSELDPRTLRCVITPGSRVIADGTAP